MGHLGHCIKKKIGQLFSERTLFFRTKTLYFHTLKLFLGGNENQENTVKWFKWEQEFIFVKSKGVFSLELEESA